MDAAKIPERREETGPSSRHGSNGSAAVDEALPAAPVKPEIPLLLAGLEAGVIGGLAMLALMIVDSMWLRHPWWSIPNLLGSVFYRHRAFHMGPGLASASGIALHLTISGLAGVVFALLFAGALSRTRSALLGIAAGLVWYYAALHVLFPRIGPLVSRYAPEPSTLLAYVLFGVCLGRFPYRGGSDPMQDGAAAATPTEAPEVAPERHTVP